jgi:hypothetical protein
MIWRAGQIGDIAGRSVEAGAAIDTTLIRRAIPLDGAVAWGQYLDDDRYRSTQWGLLGTTAAIATLALRNSPIDAIRQLREARQLVPTSTTDYDPQIRAKVDKGDFQNLIRLGFIAEALEPDRREISKDHRPQIVQHILDVSAGEPFWESQSAIPDNTPRNGDPFTTAYVVYALRRYEDPPGELRAQRTWLARQIETRVSVRRRMDLLALIGLALSPVREDPGEPTQIFDARKRCIAELTQWSRNEAIVLDRPLFNGFNLGSTTDYTFLHPEILASLYLLSVGNPIPTRRYVAKVTLSVVENVKQRGYFEGQPGMGATVDQLWAARLLDSFQRTYADESRRHVLFPIWLASSRHRWWVVVVGIVIGAAIVWLTSSPAFGVLGLVVSWILAALANVAVAWASEGGD